MVKKGKPGVSRVIKLVRFGKGKLVSEQQMRKNIVSAHEKNIKGLKQKLKREKSAFKALDIEIDLCQTHINFYSNKIGLLRSTPKTKTTFNGEMARERAATGIRFAKAQIKNLEKELEALKAKKEIFKI